MSDGLDRLTDGSWLRVFCADTDLTDENLAHVEESMNAFLGTWESHEAPVTGAYALQHRRFLIVAAEESSVPISGCSKDSVTNRIREIEVHLGLGFVATPPVWYAGETGVQAVARDIFGDLAESGAVNQATTVFDNTVSTVGQWRQRFEAPAAQSWHGQAWDLQPA